jgi:hypothetical protein
MDTIALRVKVPPLHSVINVIVVTTVQVARLPSAIQDTTKTKQGKVNANNVWLGFSATRKMVPSRRLMYQLNVQWVITAQ